jgi:hypothetical protein
VNTEGRGLALEDEAVNSHLNRIRAHVLVATLAVKLARILGEDDAIIAVIIGLTARLLGAVDNIAALVIVAGIYREIDAIITVRVNVTLEPRSLHLRVWGRVSPVLASVGDAKVFGEHRVIIAIRVLVTVARDRAVEAEPDALITDIESRGDTIIAILVRGATPGALAHRTGAAAVAVVDLARRHAWSDTICVHSALRAAPAVRRRELHVGGNAPIGELVLLSFKLPVLVDELGLDDRDLKIEPDARGKASIEFVAEFSLELPIGVKLSSAVAGDLSVALERRVPRERPQDRKGQLWLEVDSESSAT